MPYLVIGAIVAMAYFASRTRKQSGLNDTDPLDRPSHENFVWRSNPSDRFMTEKEWEEFTEWANRTKRKPMDPVLRMTKSAIRDESVNGYR